jgi:hypothetical protein
MYLVLGFFGFLFLIYLVAHNMAGWAAALSGGAIMLYTILHND